MGGGCLASALGARGTVRAMRRRSPHRLRAFALLAVLALGGGAAACTTTDPSATTVDQGAGYRQVSTTRGLLSEEDLADTNRELDAARGTLPSATPPSTAASTTTASTAPPGTLGITESTPTSEPLPGESTTTTAAPPPSLTAADCRQYQQLLTFVGQVKNLIDPNDPALTAERLGPPVEDSAAGFDQLLQTRIPEAAGPVTAIIEWLRARASAAETDDATGLGAADALGDYVRKNCR